MNSTRKQIRPHEKFLIVGTIIALVATCVSLLVSLSVYEKYTSAQQEVDRLINGYKSRTFKPNETITTGNYSLVVKEVKSDRVGIERYLPVPNGYKFITVTMQVKNLTNKEQLFLPEGHLILRDLEGVRYDVTATKDVQASLAGPIAVGSQVTGQVGFLVPDDGRSYFVHFDPYGDDTSDVAIIDITSLL